MVEGCGCITFRMSRVVFSAWTQSVVSKMFHLRSSNPPASCLDSKVAFSSTVIINTIYTSLTIDNLFFAYFKNVGLLFRLLHASRTSCSWPNRWRFYSITDKSLSWCQISPRKTRKWEHIYKAYIYKIFLFACERLKWRCNIYCIFHPVNKLYFPPLWVKNKSVPLQAWTGPEGSRKLRFPDFVTTTQDGGKVVSLTHRPPLPPGNTPGTHFC